MKETRSGSVPFRRASLALALLATSALPASVLAQGDAPAAPVEYTATETGCGTTVRERRKERHEAEDEGLVVTRERGGVWRWSREASDPRLAGAVYHRYETDDYLTEGSVNGTGIAMAPLRIENEDGAWASRSIEARLSDGTVLTTSGLGQRPDGSPKRPRVYVGEGAFAGLVAVEVETTWDAAGCVASFKGICSSMPRRWRSIHPGSQGSGACARFEGPGAGVVGRRTRSLVSRPRRRHGRRPAGWDDQQADRGDVHPGQSPPKHLLEGCNAEGRIGDCSSGYPRCTLGAGA